MYSPFYFFYICCVCNKGNIHMKTTFLRLSFSHLTLHGTERYWSVIHVVVSGLYGVFDAFCTHHVSFAHHQYLFPAKFHRWLIGKETKSTYGTQSCAKIGRKKIEFFFFAKRWIWKMRKQFNPAKNFGAIMKDRVENILLNSSKSTILSKEKKGKQNVFI